MVGLRCCIRLDLFRVGAPAQRHLVVFGNLIAAVVLLDARLAAEVVVVLSLRHPLLVAHDSAVQVGLAGLAHVKAARYRLVAADAHPLIRLAHSWQRLGGVDVGERSEPELTLKQPKGGNIVCQQLSD